MEKYKIEKDFVYRDSYTVLGSRPSAAGKAGRRTDAPADRPDDFAEYIHG